MVRDVFEGNTNKNLRESFARLASHGNTKSMRDPCKASPITHHGFVLGWSRICVNLLIHQ